VIDGRPIALVPLFTFEMRMLSGRRETGARDTVVSTPTASRFFSGMTGSVIVVDTLLPETQSRATVAAGRLFLRLPNAALADAKRRATEVCLP
jgi:hypothetical protein